MSNKSSSYNSYLQSLHAKVTTPPTVIKEIVLEGTNKDVKQLKRIIAGEMNEVYDITLNDNKHIILRVSRTNYPDFLQEKWAIEKVKEADVPVPEVILIKHLTIKEEKLSFCIESKIDGEPLERGNIDFSSLAKDVQKKYIVSAGEILSKIHMIKTTGYGGITSSDKTEFISSDQIIDDVLMRKERIYTIVEKHNLDKVSIDRSMKLIDEFKSTYKGLETCLNHGDYSHKHFMVKNEQIVAVLDWGGVRSDSPIYDFAWWDYWFGESIPTKWLQEGYTNKKLFEENFDYIFRLLKIIKGIEIIDWYNYQNYPPAVKQAFTKLVLDVNYFT